MKKNQLIEVVFLRIVYQLIIFLLKTLHKWHENLTDKLRITKPGFSFYSLQIFQNKFWVLTEAKACKINLNFNTSYRLITN
jgi:hypothetical protein